MVALSQRMQHVMQAYWMKQSRCQAGVSDRRWLARTAICLDTSRSGALQFNINLICLVFSRSDSAIGMAGSARSVPVLGHQERV